MSYIRTAIDGTMYVAMQSQSKMPNTCWGKYMHSAVVRVSPGGSIPGQIRATKTAIILWDSGPGFSGTSDRCAAAKNESKAFDLVDEYCEKRDARIRAERTAAYVESLLERSGECAA